MPYDPRMQMPRGNGFVPGQVYNSPQPMAQPMQQPMQQPMARPMQQPMQPPMQQQNGMGRMYPQLSPQDIEVFRKFQREQEVERELQQMYMQERMRGMLGE